MERRFDGKAKMSKLEETVRNHDKLTKRETAFEMAPVLGICRWFYQEHKGRPSIADEPFMKKHISVLAYGIYQGLSILAIWYGVAYGTISLIR